MINLFNSSECLKIKLKLKLSGEINPLKFNDSSLNVKVWFKKSLKSKILFFFNLTESEIRLKKLQNTLENFQHKSNKKYLQQHCEVLIENKLDNQEKYFGRTKYMTPVIFEADSCRIGELANVTITSFNQKNLFGIYKTNKVEAA